MCGSEKTGIEGAKLDLYENKMVVLTPHNEKSHELIEPLSQFWEKLNSRITILDPIEHDHCVAWVSHMPHLLMSSLIHALQHAEKKHSQVFDIAGTGLRDIARLAASNPDLWKGIVLENLPAIQKAISGMKEELTELENLLISDDKDGKKLFQYLDQANNIHRSKKLDKI
jgi:prephenate dehydrogenase